MKERQKQAKALKESRKLEVNLSVNKQTVIHETAMHAFFITVESRAELLYQEKNLHSPKVDLKSLKQKIIILNLYGIWIILWPY